MAEQRVPKIFENCPAARADVNILRSAAYTVIMESLLVTENDTHCRYIAYLAACCAQGKPRSVAASVSVSGGRIGYALRGDPAKLARYASLLTDKIAEIICVGYKYEQLSAAVMPAGLDRDQREILLAAIIAADLSDDLRYVRRRLSEERGEHCIDGFFRFRLRALSEKWDAVAACVPPVFTADRLAEFMQYVLGGGRGRVFVKGGEVFDSRCRRLRRAALIEDGKPELNTLREIVLACAGSIECLGALSLRQEHFLRTYYAGRVGFSDL